MNRVERELLEALRERIAARTQEAVAADIGISGAQLSRIVNENSPIGKYSGQRIAARYPELKSLVIEYLLQDAAKVGAA